MDRPPLSAPGRRRAGILWQRGFFSLGAAAVLALAAWRMFPGFFVTAFGFGSPMISEPLPEFTQTSADRWLNSPPLRVSDLLGKVVLLDVWTFG